MLVKKKERYKIKLIHSLLVVWAKGTHFAMQSALLVDPKALPFGTRLRTILLKTILNRFLDAKCPLRLQVPSCKKIRQSKDCLIFLVRAKGLEPPRR